MAIRNLDNVPGGGESRITNFRLDTKTTKILSVVYKSGRNKSQFIREAIAYYYEIYVSQGLLPVLYNNVKTDPKTEEK